MSTEERKPKYLFSLSDGTFVYVSFDGQKQGTRSFRLFVGPSEFMKKIKVIRISKFVDDEDIRLYLCAKNEILRVEETKDGVKAVFNMLELENLDPKDYEITETDHVVIKKK